MVTSLVESLLAEPASTVDVLLMHQQAKAVMLKEYVFGAVKSRYQKSSIVLVKSVDDTSMTRLAEIQFFAEVNYFDNDLHNCCRKAWIVAVQYFMEHTCKVWFGYPAEV